MGQILLPHAGHITEFADGFTGTCTQTALEVCLAAAEGRDPTTAHMVDLTKAMIAQKRATASGAATIAAVAQTARDLGHQTLIEWDYKADALTGDWVNVLRQHAGALPILLQVANGQALRDVETGSRDESGLHYHAIAVVGKQDDGYLCADGDNPQVAQRFQVYNLQTLSEASPCGLLMLAMKVPPPPAELVPAGWSDDGQTLRGPAAPDGQHYEVTGAFRIYILAHAWDAADVPLEGVQVDAPDRRHQTFSFHQLRVTADGAGAWGVPFVGNIGADLLALAAQGSALRDEVTHLRTAAGAVQEAIAALLGTK